jgi:hypothetical protein
MAEFFCGLVSFPVKFPKILGWCNESSGGPRFQNIYLITAYWSMNVLWNHYDIEWHDIVLLLSCLIDWLLFCRFASAALIEYRPGKPVNRDLYILHDAMISMCIMRWDPRSHSIFAITCAKHQNESEICWSDFGQRGRLCPTNGKQRTWTQWNSLWKTNGWSRSYSTHTDLISRVLCSDQFSYWLGKPKYLSCFMYRMEYNWQWL